jgi:hypothetical protein
MGASQIPKIGTLLSGQTQTVAKRDVHFAFIAAGR